MTSPAATEVAARAYGVRFRVHVSDPSLLPALVTRFPPGTRRYRASGTESFCCTVETRESGTGQTVTRVLLDDDLQSETSTDPEALDAFESLVRFEVARRTPRWTFVHAGVVGWQGRAILVPGQSFSGKSALVRALVRAGATYYSDEYAVLDRKGLVYPFAQPLMHRTDTGTRERLSIDDLGGIPGTRALPVGLVVATRYESGATWNPRSLSPAEGVLALLTNTVRAQTAPAQVMSALARAAEAAPGVESLRGDADETAAALLSRHAAWHLHRRSIA